MSLVHEALQKAAREKQRQTGAPGPLAPAPAPPVPVAATRPVPTPAAPAPRARQLWWGLAMVCVTVVGVVALVLLLRKPATNAATPQSPPPPATVATAPSQPVPPVAVQSPGFKLTGIMQDPDGSYLAVLNGRPVAAGQFVDGATVKRIERDRLILEINGHESTVPFNR